VDKSKNAIGFSQIKKLQMKFQTKNKLNCKKIAFELPLASASGTK
jgi:hypothetical protein